MSSPEYALALEEYADFGINAEAALGELEKLPVSVHCWQGDDVAGFESGEQGLGGGLVATGNYPGKARNFSELTSDLELVGRLVPGALRLNLHAIYPSDNSGNAGRDALTPEAFTSWIQWAREKGWGMDFNPSCFAHPLAADGLTLSHRDPSVRAFWINHCIASRRIGAAIGRALGSPAVTNLWIPDGTKDTPADRTAPRERLLESLDTIYSAEADAKWNIDAVESKLFGIGVESYTVGSHEFYLGYAVKRQIGLCLDAGHFHPTESIADKISAVLLFVPHLLLHVSRGVRWDSDHVVILDDATKAMLEEVAVSRAFDRIHVGMDFFDASINRIAAWTIGARNTKKALLQGLLRPTEKLQAAENCGDTTGRLALFEDAKSLPWGAVWAEYCRRYESPVDGRWMDEVRAYEREVLASRS